MPTTGNRQSPGMLEMQEAILRSIPDVVLRYNAEGVLEWASPSLEYVFGYKPSEVVGTPFELSHPDDRDALQNAARAMVVQRREHDSNTFRAVKADGQVTRVEVSARASYDKDGHVEYMVAAMRELADRGEVEQLYRILAHNTSDVVLIYDPESVILWASPSISKVLGHRPEDLVGSSEFIVHPDDVPEAMALYREALADKATSLRNRARVLRPDGSFIWMDATIVLVWSEAGDLEYAISSLHDVHEQVIVEQELRQSLERFNLLVENSNDVLYQFDANGCLAWITPNVTRLTGWQPEELIGKYRLEFVHPDDAIAAQAARDEAAAGNLATVELRMQTKDGGYRWLEASAGVTHDASGAIAGVGILRDIHARHEAQAALAASEQRFRAAMRDSAVGMCLITPEGRITDPNQALCTFLGRPAEELATVTWQELADPSEVPGDLETLDELLTGQVESMRAVRHYFLPDGTRVVGDLTVSATRTDAGVIDSLLVQIIDMTESAHLQEQVKTSEQHYRALTEALSEVVIRGDSASIIIWTSKSLTPVTGWEADDLIGRTLLEFVHPNDLEAAGQVHAALDKAESQEAELRMRMADGGYKWFAVSANPILGDGGEVTGRVATLRDLSDEVATRRLLAQREAEFRQIAEHAADVVMRLDENDKITWASSSSVSVLGYLPRDLIGRDPKTWAHPADLKAVHDFAHSLTPNTPGRLTIRARCADGEYRWFSAMATLISDSEGELASIIVGMRNIDGEVRAVEALARSEEQFRLAMASAPSGMAVVEHDGAFAQVNNSLAAMVGQSIGWLQRHGLRDIVHVDDWPVVEALKKRLIDSELASGIEEIRLVQIDGSMVRAEMSLAALRSQQGSVISFVAQFIDVTQAREAQAALHHAATHDPLTMLGNRRGLSEQLGKVLGRIPRTGTRIAILALDLDGLKPVNDRFGHATGDQVLVTVGERLRAAVRRDDPIARVGGDEFVVVLVGVHNDEQVAHLAEKIRTELSRAIVVNDEPVQVTASIGAVLAGPDEGATALLARADAALYEAKQSGRDRVVVKGD